MHPRLLSIEAKGCLFVPAFTPTFDKEPQKITVADIISATVMDLANLSFVDTMRHALQAWCILLRVLS
jgi:hypothetical protein